MSSEATASLNCAMGSNVDDNGALGAVHVVSLKKLARVFFLALAAGGLSTSMLLFSIPAGLWATYCWP